MNFKDVQNAAKHLKKTCKCQSCNDKKGYSLEDISIIATTKIEALFELTCPACGATSIVTVFSDPHFEVKSPSSFEGRRHKKVSQNDILDMKNFLNNFDGNFKKIFSKKKWKYSSPLS